MVFRRYPSRSFFLPSSRSDWSRVGDGTGSSTVMAPLLWIARTFPEAPPALYRRADNGQEEQFLDGHAMLRLLERPNSYYSGPILWMATLVDWNVDGNAYWLKIRDKAGKVVALWWVPHWLMEPRGDELAYITHYDYSPSGSPTASSTGAAVGAIPIDPGDVVHFRFGLDADDPRKGYSPLKSVLREVFTDDEAANFTAAILKNMGVPGLVVSPEGGKASREQALETKEALLDRFSGDRRGEPLVMTGPTKVEQFGFSPEQLVLRDLRRIPEERVSAVLNVPAIVAGLGAGLDRSTFTNYSEAREAAYEQNIIPSQRILGEDVRFQLLADFETDVFGWRFGFDLSRVRVLADDEDKAARQWIAAYQGGLATRAEGRRALGLTVEGEDHDVFLVPLNSTLAHATERPAPASATTTPASSNGSGDPAASADAAAKLLEGATT